MMLADHSPAQWALDDEPYHRQRLPADRAITALIASNPSAAGDRHLVATMGIAGELAFTKISSSAAYRNHLLMPSAISPSEMLAERGKITILD